VRVDRMNDSDGLQALMTNSPESWHGRETIGFLVFLATKVHPWKYSFQMADTRKNVLTGHHAKLLGHGKRE